MRTWDDIKKEMIAKMTPEQKAEWDNNERLMEESDRKQQQKAGELFAASREQLDAHLDSENAHYGTLMTSLHSVEAALERHFPTLKDVKTGKIDASTKQLFQYSYQKRHEAIGALKEKEARKHLESVRAMIQILKNKELNRLEQEFFSYATETFEKQVRMTSWRDVEKALLVMMPELSDEAKQKYQQAYDTLLDLEAVPRKEEGELVISLKDDGPLFDVSGRIKGTLEIYALGLTRWGEWLAAFVSLRQVEKIGRALYIANCLYEMTFYGWEPSDLTDVTADLEEKIETIKKNER